MKIYIFYCLDNFNIVYANSSDPLNSTEYFTVDEGYKKYYGLVHIDDYYIERGLYRYNPDSNTGEFVGNFEEVEDKFGCGECPDISTFIEYVYPVHNTP
jgi:hypothetical protein